MNLLCCYLFFGGFVGLGVLGVLVLIGCFIFIEFKFDMGVGDVKKFVLWMWLEGFDKQMLVIVVKVQLFYNVCQDIIGGDFKQKFIMIFIVGFGLFDFIGVKGEDIVFFCDYVGYFVDFNIFGVKDIEFDYLGWKWVQVIIIDGKQLGIFFDIGFIVLFYWVDIFEQVKFFSDFDQVVVQMIIWDVFIEFGIKLLVVKKKIYLVCNVVGLFGMIWLQLGKGFIDEKKIFIGDQDYICNVWDIIVKVFKVGIIVMIQFDIFDVVVVVNEGCLFVDFGVFWYLVDFMVDVF